MIIFLLLYITYALANSYLFFKVYNTFHPAVPTNISLGLFLLFMVISPFLIHFYNLRGSGTFLRVYAYIGFMWVAFITFFFSIGILFDIYNLIIRGSEFLIQRDVSGLMISPLSTFLIPFFLSIAFSIYGHFEAKDLRVERLNIKTSKLPDGVNKLTIAQISDLHLGILVREKALERVLKEVEKAEPDLIVSTGDLLDAEVNHIDYLVERLRRVQARLGKYAVTGNHEFFGGIVHSLKFLQEAGFRVLRGEAVTVQNLINIAGVDDPMIKGFKYSRTNLNEREILSGLPPDIFTLLLKHRPDTNRDAMGLFDLQLSGHTHKGQIFPINIFAAFLFNYTGGYTELPGGSAIYVSRGAGAAGPPIRFMSPPEVTIIELVPAKEMQNVKIKNQN